MEAYGDFAKVYDEFMDNTPYEEWAERLDMLITEYGISVKREDLAGSGDSVHKAGDGMVQAGEAEEETGSDREELLDSERNLVLDLGCGTGTLTELMYRKGYDMIGVDLSESMLNIAMEKREESGAQILYLLQDMRELELYSTVGCVFSVCDSLNYILDEEELLEVFLLVNNYLFPGGIFVFDFNTTYKYSEVIGDATIAENREDCSFIWDNFYDPEDGINEYDLTIFVKEKGGLFRRFSETHYQRGYTVEEMLGLVERAGMELVEVLDADTNEAVTEVSERVLVVAREHGKKRIIA